VVQPTGAGQLGLKGLAPSAAIANRRTGLSAFLLWCVEGPFDQPPDGFGAGRVIGLLSNPRIDCP